MQDFKDFPGVALVVGGSGGIGSKICRLFADYNINIQEGFPYPKIYLQKHEPQELRNQKNTKWIKKLCLYQ